MWCFISLIPDLCSLSYFYLLAGYCVDLTKKIAEYVNFDYKIKLVGDNNYGKKLKNGSWNGMVGELTKGVC